MNLFRPGSDNQPLVARALYDFAAERGNELSFTAGDELVSVCIFMLWV